jgi:microcystin-dependent protein
MGGWNFAPAGWAFCDGGLLPLSGNEALFNLIGTTYGGDGVTNFALPDLRGRLPVHVGPGFTLGQTGGAETVTLTTAQVPAHSHPYLGSVNSGGTAVPTKNVVAALPIGAASAYVPEAPTTALAAQSVGSTGGSRPHDNMMPYLCIQFIISLSGPYPSPS